MSTFSAVLHAPPPSPSSCLDCSSPLVDHDALYYATCYVAGGLSSGIRWILSPVELVKTRLQASSSSSPPFVLTTTATTSVSGSSSPSSSRVVVVGVPHGRLSSSLSVSSMPCSRMKMSTSSTTASAATASALGHLPRATTATVWSTVAYITAHEGYRGLWRGLGPTAAAYWCQTSTKYALYEFLKDQGTRGGTNNNTTTTAKNNSIDTPPLVFPWQRELVTVAAAATAEAIADVLMCPWEMIKVQLQTATLNSTSAAAAAASGTTSSGNHSTILAKNRGTIPLVTASPCLHHHPHSGSNSISSAKPFPSRFGPALLEMVRHRHLYNFPFGSIGPLWSRQIPGTIVNFYTFENTTRFLYRCRPGGKRDCTTLEQLGVTFLAGNLAGIGCAVVSHPADSIVSLRALPRHAHSSAWQIVQSVGLWTLATKGLAPRMVITGQVIAVQWLLYDSFKSMLGFPTSGG